MDVMQTSVEQTIKTPLKKIILLFLYKCYYDIIVKNMI